MTHDREPRMTGPPNKTATYAGFGNRRLLEQVRAAIPPGGAVCDLGCASGGLLAAVRDRAGTTTGVDLEPDAVAAAREVADHAIVADVSQLHEPPPGGPFDVVVCGDVLEHVATPAAILRTVRGWLAPGGVVVISVPNVAYVQARWRLLRGQWRYEPSGIFDDTHLRFFTRGTILELVHDVALSVDRVVPVVPGLRHHVPALGRLPRPIARRLERAWQRLGRRWPTLLSFQFILVVRDPRRPGDVTDQQERTG